MKRNNTLNIRQLVDDSFIPATQHTILKIVGFHNEIWENQQCAQHTQKCRTRTYTRGNPQSKALLDEHCYTKYLSLQIIVILNRSHKHNLQYPKGEKIGQQRQPYLRAHNEIHEN